MKLKGSARQKWYVCKACGARVYVEFSYWERWRHLPKGYGPKHKIIPIHSRRMTFILRKGVSY